MSEINRPRWSAPGVALPDPAAARRVPMTALGRLGLVLVLLGLLLLAITPMVTPAAGASPPDVRVRLPEAS